MGAVLTPQLIGVEEAGNLPNASTFCGRCESVCPVRIPLPSLMRHWREREFERHLDAQAVRQGLALWASWRAGRGSIAASRRSPTALLALFGRADGRYHRLPLAGGWTRFRDFPRRRRRHVPCSVGAAGGTRTRHERTARARS